MTPSSVITFIDNNDFPAPFPLSPTYEAGASDFAMIGAPSWMSINSSTGAISVTGGSASKGVYRVVITYKVTVGETSADKFVEFVLIIDDHSVLNSDTFTVCEGSEEYQIQLALKDPAYTMQDVEFTETYSDITISETGLVTIQSGMPTGPSVFSIRYNDGFDTFTKTFTINIVPCAAVSANTYTDCGPDEIRIVWRNPLGGEEVYYFNQQKAYSVVQENGSTYINQSRELRHLNRGDVYDEVQLIHQLVPKEHVKKMRSLRDSIQAWVAPNIDDVTTWKAIIIDQDNFPTFNTSEPLNNVIITFRYAKPKLIQKQ